MDSFSATSGALNDANTGAGWASPWQVQNGSKTIPGYNSATSKPLTYPGISTSGGYALGGDNWQFAGRLLDTSTGGNFSSYLTNQLVGAAGTTLFVGLLMRKDADTEDETSINLHAGSIPYWISTPGISIGYFGAVSDTGGKRYWSIRLNGIVHRTATPVIVGQTSFLVMQVSFGATNTIKFYANPPASELPASPSLQLTTTASVAFRSLAFYGGPKANESSIDEIRFASAYSTLIAGAVPAPPVPSITSAVAGNGTVALSWTAVSGASEYSIYQIANGVTELAGTSATNKFTDSSLTNGAFYNFYLIASNGAQSSAPSAQVTAVPRGPAPAAHPSLGTNLTQLADYNREWPFVDAFKTARQWIPQQKGLAWGGGPPLAVNAEGWITSLQPGQYAETVMYDNALGGQADYPVGQYTLLYEGSGTLSFDVQSATIVSQTPGRMVVNVPSGLNGIYLIESATDPANPIRDIHFILPGFESTYQTQPFHPLFLERLKNYGVLRFMEWMLTNGSAVQNWADRPQRSDYTYTWRGVPLEVMIQLANTLGVKPWFNMPALATNYFAQQFALVIKQNLNPDLSFYLEYSNETWNSDFSQSTYIASQGLALGFSTSPTLNRAYYTAHRSVEIFKEFQAVLGASNSMIRVIASQAENSWLSNQTLQFQNAFAFADVLAIAPYFNCSDAATGGFGVLGDPATATQVAAMTVEQVDTIQLAHIQNCALQEMRANAAVASSYGLKMVAYEGGQSLVGYNGAENNDPMTTLFGNVNRGAAMESLYTQYLQNWVNSGGDVFVHYSDIGAYAKWGNFGAMERQDQNPTTSPKYQALTNFANQHP